MQYHYSALIGFWLCFLVGQYLSILARAWASVTSKLSGIATYGQFFRLHGIPILIRVFLASMGFMLWHSNAAMFSKAIARLVSVTGFNISSDPFPLNPATAGIFGYFVDSILDKISILVPGMRKEIPPARDEFSVPEKKE